ncbi:MAG: hypothetical protein ABIO99_02455 [Candidatus Limnocylindria bacterium]
MPIELIGAAGAVVLVAALLWLRGGPEVRRAVTVAAVIVLAIVTAFAIATRPRAGHGGNPALSPATSSSAAPSVSGLIPTPTPTAGPSDEGTVVRHEVSVGAGSYTLFMVDAQGAVTAARSVSFDRPSNAPVDRVESGGLVHWRTVVGGEAGWSYIASRSGPFSIREIVRMSDGGEISREVDPGS